MNKNKSGREPITVFTLKQDFCKNRFADGICKAGVINLVHYSDFNLSNAFNWFGSFTGAGSPWFGGASQKALIPAAPYPFNTYKHGGYNVSSSANGTADDYTVSIQSDGLIADPLNSQYTWVQGVVLMEPSKPNHIGLEIRSTTPQHRIMLNQATMAAISATGFLEYSVENVYGNFYKIKAKALTANIVGKKFAFVGRSLSGNAQFNGTFGYPVISPNENETFTQTGDQVHINQETTPCFNTINTCGHPPSYDKEVLPLKFVSNRANLPNDGYYMPSLDSVSVTPAKLNPAGAAKSSSALGNRATFSATFKDFSHDDKHVDPYRLQRNYDPFERSTFWRKWSARNPYYMHREIEIESGYLENGAIVESTKRSFVITSFDGADIRGQVKISGRDVLTMAESNKAQAPKQSTGKLSADIDTSLSSFTLSPAGVGDLEYPAGGYIRIEKELMTFTRSGDTITPVLRGERGTELEAHSEGDTVQLCLQYTAQKPADILQDLLLNYAGIPTAYLDTANWNIEGDAFLTRLYSALITEPVGVSDLVNEMCEQMFFSIWFDERDNLVKLRAVRAPFDEQITELNDDQHFIKNSTAFKDLTDQLITQISVYYNQINPTLKLDDANNYSTVATVVNLKESDVTRHGINKIKKIYSRWINSTSTAEDLADKYISRFGVTPKQFDFRLDAKDALFWLGDFIRVQSQLLVDNFGAIRPANMQVISANETITGTEYSYSAAEYFESEIESDSDFTVIIGEDRLNVNLRALFDSEFGVNLTGAETITFVVRSGVVIGGDTCGGGQNVFYDSRNASNDFYEAGVWSVSGVTGSVQAGLVPAIQRRGITSQTNYTINDTPPDSFNKPVFLAKEYPLSVALETGTFPANTIVNLVIESGAYIVGEGGSGGFATTLHGGEPRYRAGDGGHGLKIDYPINIDNRGIIGGGGGGGSGVLVSNLTSTKIAAATGGGGAGSLSRVRNAVQFGYNVVTSFATAGTYTEGGKGAKIVSGIYQKNTFGTGDKAGGGALGQNGEFAVEHDTYSGEAYYKQAFGLAGDAIVSGKSNITWIYKGDVRGAESEGGQILPFTVTVAHETTQGTNQAGYFNDDGNSIFSGNVSPSTIESLSFARISVKDTGYFSVEIYNGGSPLDQSFFNFVDIQGVGIFYASSATFTANEKIGVFGSFYSKWEWSTGKTISTSGWTSGSSKTITFDGV